ncbi:flagellar hook capping FlgD N-terminal domain-containing protein [Haematobacter genomosp. 1]|uniref:flagellar hook capping FlgD N-terminal domain-containing protein n=1 Tax=Haematobacter genomosp. 1 TaxID=366618 RepID=UPI00211AFF04|nr:flagellar hook capping FlgD N-terminal domain-containing protein [Haematobacter genomosp. 1]
MRTGWICACEDKLDIANTTAQRSTGTPSASGGGFASTDFQTFLRMLTTQLQNQDPLNPMESSEFAVQLATFSGVEQQMRTNQLLEGLASGPGLGGVSGFSNWLGKEVAVTSPAVYDGAPLTLLPPELAEADRAVLIVRDSGGDIVAREDFPMDGGAVSWAGSLSGEAPLPPGRYSFSVQTYSGTTPLTTESVPAYQRVEEIRADTNGAIQLILRGGAQFSADQVVAMREPG